MSIWKTSPLCLVTGHLKSWYISSFRHKVSVCRSYSASTWWPWGTIQAITRPQYLLFQIWRKCQLCLRSAEGHDIRRYKGLADHSRNGYSLECGFFFLHLQAKAVRKGSCPRNLDLAESKSFLMAGKAKSLISVFILKDAKTPAIFVDSMVELFVLQLAFSFRDKVLGRDTG